MATTDDLVIDIKADTKAAVLALQAMTGQLELVNDALNTTKETLKKTEEHVDSFGTHALHLHAVLELAEKGFEALHHIFEITVEKFTEADDIVKGLGHTLEILGTEHVEHVVEKFEEFAKALERHSLVSEETTLKLITMAKAMGKTDDQAEALVRTSANLSAVTHNSVEATFDSLIQTYKGVVRGVAQYDGSLKNLTEDQLKHGKAVEVLDKTYTGFAEKLVHTIGGQAKVVAILIEHTLEDVGGLFAAFFKLDDRHVMIEALLQLNEFIKSLKPTVIEIRQTFDDFFAHLKNGFNALEDSSKLVEVGLYAVGTAMLYAFGPGILKNILAISSAIYGLVAANIALAGEIALVAGAVIAIGGALDIWRRNMKELGEFTLKVIQVILVSMSELAKSIVFIFSPENLFKALSNPKGIFDEAIDRAKEVFKVGFAEIKASADKNLSNLDFGVIGDAVKGTTNFIKGFNKELDKTGEAAEHVGTGTKRVMDTINQMSKEGQQAFDTLVKKVEELRLKQTELGENIVEIANQRLVVEQKNLDALQKELIAKGALTSEAQRLLGVARQITEENSKLEVFKQQKKALDELINKRKDMQLATDSFNKTQIEIIDMQLIRQTELLNKEKEELRIKGLLNDAAQSEFDKREALLKLGADQAKQKAPTQIQESLQQAGAQVGKEITDAFGGLVGLTDGVGAAVAAAQAVVDAIPQMLDSITHLLDSITELPITIMNSFNKLLDSILNLIAKLPENLIKGIEGIYKGFTAFLKKLPEVVTKMLQELPKMLMDFLDELPQLIADQIKALVEAGPKIAVALIEFMIRDAPRLALKIAKVLAIELPKAVLLALRDAVVDTFKMLGDFLKGKMPKIIDAKKIGEDLSKEMKKLSGSAARLFEVKDLVAAAKDSKDIIKQIDEAAKRAGRTLWWQFIKDAADWFAARGREIWDGFLKPIAAWFGDRGTEIWKGFLKPIFDWFGSRGTEIWNGFLKPILTWFGDRGTEIWNGFLKPILNWFGDQGTKIWTGFLAPIGDWFLRSGGYIWTGFLELAHSIGHLGLWIWDGFWKAVTDSLTFIYQVGKWIWDGFWNAVKAGMSFLGDMGTAIWKGLIAPVGNWFGDRGTEIWKSLANNGVVQWFGDRGTEIWKGFFKPIGNFFGEVGTDIWNALKRGLAAIGEFGTNIWKGLKDGLAGIGAFGTNIWKGLLDGLNNPGTAFQKLGGYIVQGLKDGLSGFGEFFTRLIDNINPSNLFKKIFNVDYGGRGTVEKALDIDIPFLNFAKGGLVPGSASIPGDSEINDRIVALLSPGEAIISRSKLKNPAIRALVDAIVSGKIDPPAFKLGGVLGSIAHGDIKGAVNQVANVTPEQVLKELKNGADVAADALKMLNPAQLWDTVRDKVFEFVTKMFEANRFATGGIVGDTVPAMLTPGEYVMNRNAVNTIGIGNLNGLNAGRGMPSSGVSNYTINVAVTIENKGQTIDASWVRDKILPTIKSELKRASLEGNFVVSSKGIRDA